MYLVNAGSSADPKIDPAMIRFWGKPLSDWDFQVCKALGWITAQGEGAAVSWHPSDKAKAFKGQIYKRGKLVRYTVCEEVLGDFVCHYLLSCLDPYFRKSAEQLRLRLLLTLVNLVFHCYADYVASDEEIMFVATPDLAPLGRSESDEELEALARQGVIGAFLDEDGKLRWTLTPKGLWFGQSVDDQRDDLRNICVRLEEHGLLRRAMDQRGVLSWTPTKEGYRRGLGSTTITLADLLADLGLDEFLEHRES
jgi:hypothetical protein